MVRVQQAFGLLIGWFALGYLWKGLVGAGFSDEASWALLAGVALVFVAAFYAHDPDTPIEARTRRAGLVVLGVVGFFVVGRAMLVPGLAVAAAGTTRQASVQPASEVHGNLSWHLDKETAYAAARQTGRPVFVDFHGDWCTNCNAFQGLALSNQRLNAALGRSVLLKVRDTTALFDEYRRDPRFPELKVGLPFFLVTDAKGELLYKTSDYTKVEEMALFLPESVP
jgi:thioredoxin:protein disulfide reductase